ncbi:MAG: uracil-xanthine permease, partial [Clostridia bacterium]|nr:uracil-xanthine permease [Clostridia bacterium]
MKLYYDIQDKPKFPQLIIYAIQQLLAIMAATLVVPLIIGHDMQPSAALFGAGVGTLIYQLFTRGKSPVFLGSSFAFIGSMSAAFAGGVSAALGYAGIILGAVFAGLVYVVIALLVKFVGVNWIDKLMPKQVIGPTVAIIGLSLAANAIGDLQKGDVNIIVEAGGETVSQMVANPLIAVLCGLVALFVTMICSTYGKKSIKLIPFIIGILSGYALAAVFTVIGNSAGIDALKVIDFGVFSQMSLFEIPNFTFLTAMDGIKEINASYIGTIAMAYLPVAFVVFAEHIADHKNISS